MKTIFSSILYLYNPLRPLRRAGPPPFLLGQKGGKSRSGGTLVTRVPLKNSLRRVDGTFTLYDRKGTTPWIPVLKTTYPLMQAGTPKGLTYNKGISLGRHSVRKNRF